MTQRNKTRAFQKKEAIQPYEHEETKKVRKNKKGGDEGERREGVINSERNNNVKLDNGGRGVVGERIMQTRGRKTVMLEEK